MNQLLSEDEVFAILSKPRTENESVSDTLVGIVMDTQEACAAKLEPVAIAEGRSLYWIASQEPKDDEKDIYLYAIKEQKHD